MRAANDIENFLILTPNDNTRWDYLRSGITNLRYRVPIASTVVVGNGDEANLPGIAQRVLGDRFLWHVLLHYNGLYDALRDVVPGMVLNVPDRAILMRVLAQREDSSTPETNFLSL
jgi:nucleoid-associated protein YgaU